MPVKTKITAASIKELKTEDKRINDTEITGFHALISPKKLITYYLYYRIHGKQANYRLGIHGHITAAQARDLAKSKIAEVTQGVDVHAVKKKERIKTKESKLSTLQHFLDEKYFPWLLSRNPKTAEKTKKAFQSAFSKFMDFQLSTITAWEVEKWRNKRLANGIKPATTNRQINLIKGCLSRAVEWEVIDSHDLQKVKAQTVDNAKVRYLSKDEESRLRESLAKLDIKHLTTIVILAINTGMRKGEILSLQWNDINLENKVLTVDFQNAKSGNTRHIPLNKQAFNVLSDWQKISGNIGYVFKDNKQQRILDFRYNWAALLEDANITDFRFHDLRHHFASKLVMASVDLNTVRELLGHSDLKMTLRYAHLAPEHKAAAVNLIG
ncbi:site-specific integrase [Pseudoalteromonas distincta]|uniref:site-specific integrase n=1 Tax=Pseudoalteromonas distincta TaxID=77608 RepID=UPI00119274D3|nr:site-specific integrase [Pseudoalteromonas elyakovii]TVU76142.1 site-specific integrase [Pseudoalteromonas elyakovii]|tara:strand:- start:2856 stop:4001 length:1146 start_codon:yes stop_codon:yes gene_type:complete